MDIIASPYGGPDWGDLQNRRIFNRIPSMPIVYYQNQVPIRLTAERWKHIVTYHPEMDGQRDAVLETVANPSVIQQGDFGELLASRFCEGTPLGDKYLVVAYREVHATDGFILTAYFARRLSKQREILWKR